MKNSLGVAVSMAVGLLLTATACNDSNTIATDSYDRGEMLAHWANNIIVPGYQAYVSDLTTVDETVATFTENPSFEQLADLREAVHLAYTTWQRVSMFDIGPAEALQLRSNTNTYPTNVNSIEAALNGSAYNLTLVSTIDQQGFPALDYLLYQDGLSDQAVVDRLSSAGGISYLKAVTDRLLSLGNEVLLEWQSDYRTAFVSASDNSATSSLDLLVNDVIFYYEKHLRAGKVGIPAGVFSDTPLPNRIESLYNPEQSRLYLATAINAFSDFVNGIGYDGQTTGPGLMDYSDYLDEIRDADSQLSEMIRDQLSVATAAIEGLDDNLARQVESDNLSMLNTYDQLQRLVPLLKIDMVQSMGVNIDFVDTDGD